jgi:sterol desaturase/sphingolipid hydroxylase (fatty acid hydroxylase superfamily)
MEASLRLGAFCAVFAAMALWEVAAPRRTLVESRRRRWPANLGLVVLSTLVVRLTVGSAAFAAAVFAADRGVGLLHWIALPPWVAWAVTLLGLDFAIYLQHVAFHAVPVLWRLHRVHHADVGFDTTTGLRFHPLEVLLSLGIKAGVVMILGADPWAVVAFEIVLNASSLFEHGNVAIPESLDRRLRWLIVTPDMHRIHHSRRVVETNSNFGFASSWWDRLCGTYRPEPAQGQLGLEIGLDDFPRHLDLGQLLLLPVRDGSAAG